MNNESPFSPENRQRKLDSPEQIGSTLKITALPTYLLACTVLLLLGAFFVWGFLGSVSDKVYYSGVVFPQEGTADISLPNRGMVRTMFLHSGDHVVPGQSVALISVNDSYSILTSTVEGTVISSKVDNEAFEAFEPILSVVSGNAAETQRAMLIAYIDNFDLRTKTGYRFSLEQFDGNTITSRLTAETVRYDSAGLWTLNNYTIRRFDGLKETKIGGAHIDTMLNVEPRDFLISHNDEQTLTSPQLREYILKQKDRGVANIKNFEIEYERRYAMTAAAFILTIIGLSLSSRKVRGGMGMNIGIGLLLSFSYILFMTVTSTFCVSGYTSARVAMWIPNIIYTFIAAFLYARASR